MVKIKTLLISIGGALIVGIIAGGAGVYGIFNAGTEQQLGERDSYIGELERGYSELASDNRYLAERTRELIATADRRRDIEYRARTAIEGIGSGLDKAEQQTASLAEKVRNITAALKIIASRTRYLEDLYRDSGGSSGY